MPDVLIDHESAADLIVERVVDVVVEQAETLETIVTEALQGPPGIQGIPGPAGGATTIIVGPSPLSGHTAVAVNSAGLLVYADCTDAAQLGLTLGVLAGAYAAGDQAVVQTDFELTHAGWTFATGPVYVGAGGALVQALPPGAVFVQVIGYATAPTRLRIHLQPPILIS